MCFKILPTDKNLTAAYLEDYAASEGIENYMLGEAARKVFRRVLLGIDLAPRAGRPRLLDIGTGLGGLLEEADKLGFDAQGIDLCEPLVRKARERGLRVECKPAEQLTNETQFDVVTILDTIEHVMQPLALLGAAHRVLKPGGELVVYTQNHRAAVVIFANCLNAVGLDFAVNEIFGSNHVSFFDDRTLPVAVRQEGFVIRQMKFFPYDSSRPGQPISLVSLAVVSAVELVGRPFGRMFRLLLYAQPKT
jgi:2-polyprenyl-3-methyl-5-hydroxy-6-metoxy-1,4-benzoquinol methylase